MKNLLRGLISRPVTQRCFLQILKLCHAGMNYGGGHSPADSGERDALALVRKSVDPSRSLTLFDAGANDGEYLKHALEIVGDRARIFAFEPQTLCYERLRARFASESRVELVKAALGSATGTAELFARVPGESTASLHRNTIAGQAVSEIVQMTTVDEVCRKKEIGRIDLLKIDTEGSEIDVIAGAAAMIEAGCIAFIQFEFGDPFLHTPFHFLDLWDRLSPRYAIHRILRYGLTEVRAYSADLEIYKVANFLCVQRY